MLKKTILFRMQTPCRNDRRPPATRINLDHKSSYSTPLKTAYLATMINLTWILLLGDESLCSRKLYFSECELHVGMTASFLNKFRSQKFLLNSLKNGLFGNHDKTDLVLITGG